MVDSCVATISPLASVYRISDILNSIPPKRPVFSYTSTSLRTTVMRSPGTICRLKVYVLPPSRMSWNGSGKGCSKGPDSNDLTKVGSAFKGGFSLAEIGSFSIGGNVPVIAELNFAISRWVISYVTGMLSVPIKDCILSVIMLSGFFMIINDIS